MLSLFGIAFLAGVVAGISPCILPVLPVVLVGWSVEGADEGTFARQRRRRALSLVAGLVISFSLFTAVGAELLSAAHLPDVFLHDLGIATLFIFGLSLVVPRLAQLLERPFARFAREGTRGTRSSFLCGIGLGFVFVPCAGPVLATVAVLGARHHASFTTLALSFCFGVGVCLPLLVVALAGDRLIERNRWLTARARRLRPIAGMVLIVMSVSVALNLTAPLQRALPSYTASLQHWIEGGQATTKSLRSLSGERSADALAQCEARAASGTESGLSNCGIAPEFKGITGWLNTNLNKPLTMQGQWGHVVLIDFWTYSCINCQRSLPHVKKWYDRYRGVGLQVVGVASPEFAFEHDVQNVKAGAQALGVHYPIAVDANLATWQAYANQYWPADYLIDATGMIRHVGYGEGNYTHTESLIRSLLRAVNPSRPLPPPTSVADTTPTGSLTPETYLGADRSAFQENGSVTSGVTERFVAYPSTQNGYYDLGGTWTASGESITAGEGAEIIINFTAKKVFLVLAGDGTVTEQLNGRLLRKLQVRGVPSLHQLVALPRQGDGELRLSLTKGLAAYAFTFG